MIARKVKKKYIYYDILEVEVIMHNWQNLLAVQKMQDYIKNHLKEPITLLNLAKVAEYSPYHSAKIFKEVIGKAPFEYIREFRLSEAAVTLNEKSKIIDVAFDFVFDSHEGFTRAFTKRFGVSPSKFIYLNKSVQLFMPENCRNYYLTLLKGADNMPKTKKPNTNTVFVQVVERPKRKMIIKRGINAIHYFEYCNEVGCEIWNELSNIKEAINEPMGLWLPDNMIKPNTSKYVQGVEVSSEYSGKIPDGYEIIELSACKMMIFQGQPYDDNKFEQAINDLWEVMKNYNPEIYGFKWADDIAPRFQLIPMGYRGYIEGKPVESL